VAVNVLAPFGFRPARLFNASVPNYAITPRSLAYNYASQIAQFDPVYLYTTGNIQLYAAGGTTIDGIAIGFDWFDPNNILSGSFHNAWTAPTLASTVTPSAKVITDPNMVFIAQVHGNGTPLTESSVGLNIDIYSGSSGTPTSGSGLSVCALDGGNIHTTNTLPFRIVGILGITPGWGTVGLNVANGYVPTNDNQYVAVTMNTQDMTTRTGQA
jgi:hypothetical protein